MKIDEIEIPLINETADAEKKTLGEKTCSSGVFPEIKERETHHAKSEESFDDIKDSFDNILDFNAAKNALSVNALKDDFDDILGEKISDGDEAGDIFVEEKIDKRPSTKSRKKKKKKLVYNLIMTILVCVFVGCAAYLINYYVQAKKSQDKFDALKELIIVDDDIDYGMEATEYVPEFDDKGDVKPPTIIPEPTYVDVDGRMVLKKYSELYRRNRDFYAWLTIGDTVVNYPVMYTPREEDYYLHRDFDQEYSDAGTLFIDVECDVETPGDNLIIYGHNMLSGKMFASILEYENEEYFKKYKYIQFNTLNEEAVYEVIAAFRTEIFAPDYKGFKYYNFINAKDEGEFNDYVSNCRARTPYETSTAEYGDKLITLSTCAYHSKNGRYVVVAKRIENNRNPH